MSALLYLRETVEVGVLNSDVGLQNFHYLALSNFRKAPITIALSDH